jgi:hypothetical protein
MALESTQSLTEMSTRNLPGGKGRPGRKADNLTAICEMVVKKCGNLDVSQTYGPPRLVKGIALPLILISVYKALMRQSYTMNNEWYPCDGHFIGCRGLGLEFRFHFHESQFITRSYTRITFNITAWTVLYVLRVFRIPSFDTQTHHENLNKAVLAAHWPRVTRTTENEEIANLNQWRLAPTHLTTETDPVF